MEPINLHFNLKEVEVSIEITEYEHIPFIAENEGIRMALTLNSGFVLEPEFHVTSIVDNDVYLAIIEPNIYGFAGQKLLAHIKTYGIIPFFTEGKFEFIEV